MSVDNVRVIERAWLAYRDRQIFQILKSVLSVGSHDDNCHLLLQRLSPIEARLFNAKTAEGRVLRTVDEPGYQIIRVCATLMSQASPRR